MPGFSESLVRLLTIVQQLTELERRHDRESKAALDGLSALRTEVKAIDRRLIILETRFDGLAQQTATEARAAAQSAASLVVVSELRSIGERLARLEALSAPARQDTLPPPS